MKFYSEFGEDKWIAENLTLPPKGTYVDVGCGHPERESNTAFLRDKGWDGIAIDGRESVGNDWEGIPFICAVLTAKDLARFELSGLCSRIAEQGEERVGFTLDHILSYARISKIDFLSIDIEGAEYDVFLTMDMERHAPEVIVAEFNTRGMGEDFRLRDHLLNLGYTFRHRTIANLIFTRT